MRISLDRDRFVETMQEQAEIGGTEAGGLHRLALSDADKRARDWLSKQFESAGLSVRVDEFGNMFGRRSGTDPEAGAVLVGSHLDSQPYGGMYDGSLGVVAALECVRTLEDEGIRTRRPIEVVNWTNEEGSRFPSVTQGSGVWSGTLDIEEEYAQTDADGRTVEAELERIGYKGTTAAEPTEAYHCFLELHIEQGTRLEDADAPVGAVTGVVGLSWGEITFSGTANHTGTTPMYDREDALVAAADVTTAMRRIVGTLGERTVGTVGRLEAAPNSINVVPGGATLTWDIRDPADEIVAEGRARTIEEAKAAAAREGVEIEWEDRSRTSSVEFADTVIEAIRDAADDLGYASVDVFSGAIHDAANVATVCDTAMVFAVSEGGKSHTEAEYTSWEDCYRSANALANAALSLAER